MCHREHFVIDYDESCNDDGCEALQIAQSVYVVIEPTHDHAHHMNENPCWECTHGLRYHGVDGCIVPGCECSGDE